MSERVRERERERNIADDENFCAFDFIAFPKATDKKCDESWHDTVLKVPTDCSTQKKIEIFDKMLLAHSIWGQYDSLSAACSAQKKVDASRKIPVEESVSEQFDSMFKILMPPKLLLLMLKLPVLVIL